MKINIEVKDRNGTPLEIGDRIKLYDWGFHNNDYLGEVTLVWDPDEGRISSDPCLIEDPYDFWTKALPKCEKVVENE